MMCQRTASVGLLTVFTLMNVTGINVKIIQYANSSNIPVGKRFLNDIALELLKGSHSHNKRTFGRGVFYSVHTHCILYY
jgi:hypothetical protein